MDASALRDRWASGPGRLWALSRAPRFTLFLHLSLPLVLWVVWLTGIDWLWLHLSWPALSLASSASFVGGQALRHRLDGVGVHRPKLATATVLTWVGTNILLLSTTGPDWPGHWVAIGGVAIVASAGMTMAGFVADTELWRLLFNDAVVGTVWRRSGTAARRATGSDRWLGRWLGRCLSWWAGFGWVPWTDRWGRAHRLKIVLAHYEDAKLPLLGPSGTLPGAELALCVAAGTHLLEYLEHRWAAPEFSAEERQQMQRDTAVELAVICLTAGRHTGGQAATDVFRRVDALLAAHASAESDFLRFALGIGRRPECAEPAQSAAEARQAVRLFRELRGARLPSASLEVSHRARRASHAWLAIARYGVLPEAAVDAWIEMRQLQGETITLEREEETSCDASRLAARRYLAEWYGARADAAHPEWRHGIDGRGRYASAAMAAAVP